MIKRPNTAFAIITLLTLALAGCTRRYTLTTVLGPSSEMTVEIVGSAPFAQVRNGGPGVLHVTFDAGGAAADGPRRLTPHSTSGRTLRDTNRILLVAGPEQGAEVSIHAHRASGMSIDLPIASPSLEPPAPSAFEP